MKKIFILAIAIILLMITAPVYALSKPDIDQINAELQ
jgi:hypothetical protein